MEKQRVTLTPGTPGFIAAKQNEEGSQINEDQLQEYQSEVGTLLYVTRHSRPDLANAVRELYKSMDGQSCNSERYGLSNLFWIPKTLV